MYIYTHFYILYINLEILLYVIYTLLHIRDDEYWSYRVVMFFGEWGLNIS